MRCASNRPDNATASRQRDKATASRKDVAQKASRETVTRFCVTPLRATVLRDAFRVTSFRCGEAGGGLLSHDLSIAVPSALTGLTTVFGMGTGVALSR